ncbi:hypothetical protein JCM10212_006775 [Sporobolomyces blumeae]
MPRSAAAGPAPATDRPDYFDSLQALEAYFDRDGYRSRPSRSRAPPRISRPRHDGKFQQRGKLLVCHDYKGGYTEDAFERGYTLSWWHLIDTFIYFSHHRVSTPPPDWIRTAHRHGTSILGTLIFEWDAGRSDIVRLVVDRTADPDAEPEFETVDFRFADHLVDLAVERGFDGWLVNVEVELGGKQEPDGTRRGAREHAQALLVWLVYLTNEMHKRVPGSQVMWYDAVTVDGNLAWQNSVNDRNLPFFAACDSIFLNYFWRPPRIESTAAVVIQQDSLASSDVYFGIDVYGRGSYGGGGFESWRAFEAIERADKLPSSTSDPTQPTATPSALSRPASSFSIALFAPGWTVESSDLGHSLDSSEAYQDWWADELYLWSNGSKTANVQRERERMRQVRRDEVGVHRARQLAQALYRDRRMPLAFRPPVEPLRLDLSSLPDPPGSFRSICEFLSLPRPIPTDADETFYTNFSNGSGHSFWIDGATVLKSEKGWTDVDWTFPFPSLAYQGKNEGVEVEFVENDAWQGSRAFKVKFDGSGSAHQLSLFTLDYTLRQGQLYSVEMVWKAVDTSSSFSLDPILAQEAYPSQASDGLANQSKTTRSLSKGWNASTSTFAVPTLTVVSQLVAVVSGAGAGSCLIGSVSLAPKIVDATPCPIVRNVRYDRSTGWLAWDVAASIASLSSASGATDVVRRPIPSILFSHVYRSTRDHNTPIEYLGSTRESQFALKEEVVGERTVLTVVGVLADHSTVQGRVVA